MVELFNLVGSQTTNCANSIAAQPSKFGKGSQREDVNVFLQSNQSQKIIMESTSMHYLPSLDGPPTEHSIIMKVMKKTLQMEESLSGISSRIVCVFDQSVFAKAAGIKWRDPSK